MILNFEIFDKFYYAVKLVLRYEITKHCIDGLLMDFNFFLQVEGSI